MSVGLLALLDDVAALAKVAAASLDDIAGQAAKAGLKAAGAVVDDAAVTPRYVDGFAADRELPIVGRIAWGSVRNKLVFLLPTALILSLVAPWVITPILMLGGAYLCYEGAEKVFHALMPHEAEGHEAGLEPAALDPQSAEDARVAGAIKTDFILSAEIMTISLAAITVDNFWTRAAILALVGIGITAVVYGAVAVLVKADDFGLLLARKGRLDLTRKFGRWLVRVMPIFMQTLAVVGTAAMIWVGGGIILHGLAEFGLVAPEHWIEAAAHWAEHALPAIGSFAGWAMTAFIDGIFGLAFGLVMIPLAGFIVTPIWRAVKRLLPKRTRSVT
ncbi:MAG: ABC transporter [Pelagibacterium sp. SCN 63-23]|nr:MAG: ABC transporter [Pelagibacterium sp. SCN 63-23]